MKKFALREKRVKLVAGKALYCDKSIDSPEIAAKVLGREIHDSNKEIFAAIYLDSKLMPLNYCILSMGTVNSSVVSCAEVFKPALLLNATSIVLMHNHPSGSLTPSKDDIAITEMLIDLGRRIGVPIEDHIIVTSGGLYHSMKEYSDTEFGKKAASLAAE